jgi:hypothetical protein
VQDLAPGISLVRTSRRGKKGDKFLPFSTQQAQLFFISFFFLFFLTSPTPLSFTRVPCYNKPSTSLLFPSSYTHITLFFPRAVFFGPTTLLEEVQPEL